MKGDEKDEEGRRGKNPRNGTGSGGYNTSWMFHQLSGKYDSGYWLRFYLLEEG